MNRFLFLSILLLISKIYCDAQIKLGIISDANYCGEREMGWRIKLAAEQLGWEAILDENHGADLVHETNFDFVICLLPKTNYFDPRHPNYLTIFHPFNFLDEEGKLYPIYERFDGYLMTIPDREKIQSGFKGTHKIFHALPFYPTVPYFPYKEVEIKELVTMIPVWSNRLYNVKFKKLYKKLSQNGTKFYGLDRNEHIIEKGFMGKIPFDGKSVIDVLQKHGIVLILHSNIHNNEGIPSSRIFEAAAASTVIISDENAFIREHFGDSVLFVDTTQESDEIFDSIQKHLNWIFANPEEALIMAKKAHETFVQDFEMSKQLIKLEQLNQQVKIQKKKK